MDKLDIQETSSNIPQPKSAFVDVSLQDVQRVLDNYVSQQSSDYRQAWKHGSMIGKDVVSSHKKVMENLLYLILDDIKEHGEIKEHANYIYEQAIAGINNMVNIFTTTGMDINDSKRLVTKLLGYIFSLHNMQKDT